MLYFLETDTPQEDPFAQISSTRKFVNLRLTACSFQILSFFRPYRSLAANGHTIHIICQAAMQRFKYWCILFFSGIIYLLSVLDAIDYWKDDNNQDAYRVDKTRDHEYYERWAISTAILTIVLSLGGIVCWLLPQKKIVQRIEVFFIFLVVALNGVVATFAVIKPSHKLSSDTFFLVVLPNVFVFGWLCIFSGIWLLANWVSHDIQHDDGVATVQWILLGSSSFVVMISAHTFRDASYDTVISYLGNNTKEFQEQLDADSSICMVNQEIDCTRVTLAVVLGAVSAVTAICVAAWMNAPKLCQSELSLLLVISWVVGVALLTFDTGPGKIMGNIYFGTWASLLISVDIFFTTIKASQNESPGGETDVGADAASNAVDRDAIFGVAQGRLGIPIAGWSSERRGSVGSSRIRKGLSSVLFSSVGEWNGPSEAISSNERNSQVSTSEIAQSTTQRSLQAQRHKLTRLEFWILLLLLSSVCLSALFPALSDKDQRTRHQVFALAAPSVCIALSACGYITCLMQQKGARYAELGLVRYRKGWNAVSFRKSLIVLLLLLLVRAGILGTNNLVDWISLLECN